jgi:hypothetical protein
MPPWTFDVKFLLGTRFTFGSLMFAAGVDGDLNMLPPGPAPEHPAPAPSSTSGSTCSGLDPFIGLYIRTAKLIRGMPIVTSTLQTSTGASMSSSTASSPSRNSVFLDRDPHNLDRLCIMISYMRFYGLKKIQFSPQNSQVLAYGFTENHQFMAEILYFLAVTPIF